MEREERVRIVVCDDDDVCCGECMVLIMGHDDADKDGGSITMADLF